MAAKRTDLAPIAVEKVARRLATESRRTARSMRITAAIAFLLGAPALFTSIPLSALAIPAVLGMLAYQHSRRREELARAADQVAAFAAKRPELEWVYAYGLIEARHPGERAPVYAFRATPRQVEIDGHLPAARILSEGSRDE